MKIKVLIAVMILIRALQLPCTTNAAQEFLTYTNKEGITITNAEVVKRMPDGILVRIPGKFGLDKIQTAPAPAPTITPAPARKLSIYEMERAKIPPGLSPLELKVALVAAADGCAAKAKTLNQLQGSFKSRYSELAVKADAAFDENAKIRALQKEAELQTQWDQCLANRITLGQRAREALSTTQKFNAAEKQAKLQRDAYINKIATEAVEREAAQEALCDEYYKVASRLLADAGEARKLIQGSNIQIVGSEK